MMRQSVIAGAWLVGSIVPVSLATIFFFGCCVLPFHRTLHQVAPLCHIAAKIGAPDHSAGKSESTPAPFKTEQTAKKAVPTELTPRCDFLVSHEPSALQALRSNPGYRSFISLGALRCDEDVGIRLSFLDTYRI